MEDIKEAEVESVADLGAFLDSELEYYDRCRDVLMQLKRDWPARCVYSLFWGLPVTSVKMNAYPNSFPAAKPMLRLIATVVAAIVQGPSLLAPTMSATVPMTNNPPRLLSLSLALLYAPLGHPLPTAAMTPPAVNSEMQSTLQSRPTTEPPPLKGPPKFTVNQPLLMEHARSAYPRISRQAAQIYALSVA
jgi:hypothetical protein